MSAPTFKPQSYMFVCMDPTGCYHVSWDVEQHRAKMDKVGAIDEARYVQCQAAVDPFRQMIDELRRDEGDQVTILCDNPDFNGQPNNAVIVSAGWAHWQDFRVSGHTLDQALSNAVAIKKMAAEERPTFHPDQEAPAWVADYGKSDGTTDFFVMIGCGGREMSLHSHRVRGRAEHEAAEINHVLTGSAKPDFDDFEVDTPTPPERAVSYADAMAMATTIQLLTDPTVS